MTSHHSTKFFLESIIDIIHPIPYLEYSFTIDNFGIKITYQLQTFLYAFMLFKLHHLIKLFAVSSIAYNMKIE